MGLLDGLLGDSFDDPRTTGNLAMAQGLLSDPRGMRGLASGLLARQETIHAVKQQQTQEQMQQLQMAQMQQKQALIAPLLQGLAGGGMAGGSPGAQPQPSLPAGMPPGAQEAAAKAAGAGQQIAQLPAPQKTSMLQQMTPEHIAAIKMAGGPDLMAEWKAANEGIKLDPGAGYRMPDGSFRSMPSVSQNGQASQVIQDPNAPGGYRIITPSGALDAYSGYRQADKDIETRNTPVSVDMRERFPGLPASATVKDLLTPSGGAQPGGPFGKVLGAMAANGDKSADFNIGGATGTLTAPGAASKFKTAAELEADKLAATGPQALRNKMLSDAHTANADFVNKLSDTVRSEAEIQNRNAQILPMLDQYKTGGFGAEQRANFANMLANSDLLPAATRASVAAKIAGGDPSIGVVIENQLATAGIKTMLDTLDKEGKPNRAIFDKLAEAQEDIRKGNPALRKVFDLQKQLYDWHYGQLQSSAKKIAADDYNPMMFAADIARERNASLAAPSGPAASSSAATHRWNPQTGKIEAVGP